MEDNIYNIKHVSKSILPPIQQRPTNCVYLFILADLLISLFEEMKLTYKTPWNK